MSGHLDIDVTAVDPDRISAQVHADGGAFRLTRAIIELAVMFGAFDQVAHHQPVAEMHLFMGAFASRGEEIAFGRVIDGIGGTGVIEADQILFVDIIGALGGRSRRRK
jgi:hypothetical protein